MRGSMIEKQSCMLRLASCQCSQYEPRHTRAQITQSIKNIIKWLTRCNASRSHWRLNPSHWLAHEPNSFDEMTSTHFSSDFRFFRICDWIKTNFWTNNALGFCSEFANSSTRRDYGDVRARCANDSQMVNMQQPWQKSIWINSSFDHTKSSIW